MIAVAVDRSDVPPIEHGEGFRVTLGSGHELVIADRHMRRLRFNDLEMWRGCTRHRGLSVRFAAVI